MTNRGGKREGAGRKCQGDAPMKKIGITMPIDLLEKIDADAKKSNLSRSSIIQAHVEKGFK